MTPTQLINYYGDDKSAAYQLGKTVTCIRKWVEDDHIPLWSQYAIQAITNLELKASKTTRKGLKNG